MCWLLVLLECFTIQDLESKFFIRVTPSGRVEKTDPLSTDYPTDYSTDYPTDYPYGLP